MNGEMPPKMTEADEAVIADVLSQSAGILLYDLVLPEWPRPAEYWTPFRNVFPRWRSGKVCYTLPSGNMVHVKPGCRC